jgi:hypothetical protein
MMKKRKPTKASANFGRNNLLRDQHSYRAKPKSFGIKAVQTAGVHRQRTILARL